MRIFESAQDLLCADGASLGTGSWVTVTEQQVADFLQSRLIPGLPVADPASALGYLVVALTPGLLKELYRVRAKMGVNYGLDLVEFGTPVSIGSQIRISSVVRKVEALGGGVQLSLSNTIELNGSDAPAALTETVSRVYF